MTRPALTLGLLFATLLAGGCPEDVTLGTDPPFCQGKACGAPCSLRLDGGALGAGVCDGNVACTAQVPACALMLPCQGQKCGATCSPPPMPMMPPGPFACDAQGMCAPGPPTCPPDPCHGLPCGALCNPLCDPQADGGCPPPPMAMACDMAGQCADAHLVGCKGMPPWVPCMGLACGLPCKLCDPMNPMCKEAPLPKACDPMGVCTPVMVTCM